MHVTFYTRMSPFTHQIYSQSSLIVLANYVNVDFRLILFIAKMRQKIEAEIKSDGIKVIKVTHSIKPSLKSILTFWLTWHGALVAKICSSFYHLGCVGLNVTPDHAWTKGAYLEFLLKSVVVVGLKTVEQCLVANFLLIKMKVISF